MNTSLFKEICSTYATGVTVITSKDSTNKDYGFTANSFTSVSIDPLLVLFCLNKKASFNYFFEDVLEAGIVLKGSEIK